MFSSNLAMFLSHESPECLEFCLNVSFVEILARYSVNSQMPVPVSHFSGHKTDEAIALTMLTLKPHCLLTAWWKRTKFAVLIFNYGDPSVYLIRCTFSQRVAHDGPGSRDRCWMKRPWTIKIGFAFFFKFKIDRHASFFESVNVNFPCSFLVFQMNRH